MGRSSTLIVIILVIVGPLVNIASICAVFQQICRNILENEKEYHGLLLLLNENITNTSTVVRDEMPYPFPLCSRQELISGFWEQTIQPKPVYISKTEHLRCYPIEKYHEAQWKTYKWKPKEETCKFSDWNATDFCSLVKYGTVLIVGDSLSWEHYSSLGQMLGLRIHQTSQFKSLENKMNHIQLPCERKTRLAFRRDDILSNLSAAISESFPTVLVLNRGAHYQNDTALMNGIQKNIREIKNWQQRCRKHGIKCHFFWRTTVPGHPLCDRIPFLEPNNDLAAMEAWIGNLSNYNNHTIRYQWFNYQHQNELVLQALRAEFGEDEFEIIDAYYLNVLRPDEHRAHQGDCLHNCYPGKMDVYNHLLLHYLKVQRYSQDVEDLKQLLYRSYENRLADNSSSEYSDLT